MSSERIIAAIARGKNMPVEKISMDSTFEELEVDSLDALNIVFEVEEEFDIQIPDDKVREFRTVRQVVDALDEIVSQDGTPAPEGSPG